MKIALVAYHLDPQTSPGSCPGAEQAAHVRGLALSLGSLGHRVTVYARRGAAGRPDGVALGRSVTVRYLPAGPASPVAADELPAYLGECGGQLATWLRRTAPDVVHAYHWTSGLAAHLASREYAVPIVQSFGSLAAAEQRSGTCRPADRRRLRMESSVASAAAGVLAATTAEAAELARLGVPGSLVRVVPPGVDAGQFGNGRAARRIATPAKLLYIGPVDADQRVDVLIRALVELPGAELVLAAELAGIDLDDDSACKKLGKLAADLGVADRVTFIARPAEEDLPGLLRSATMLVSAARHQPLGMATISAMASGLPVIAPGTGAYADAVIDRTTGLLLPPARPELLGKTVRGLLATPMRLTGFGIAAADRAVSRYAWHRIGREAAAAYEHFLALAGTTSPARQQGRAERQIAA